MCAFSNDQSAILRWTPILIGTPLLNLLFCDAKLLTESPRLVRGKNAAVIAHQNLWDAVLANCRIEDRKERLGILLVGDRGGKNGAREIFEETDAVDHAVTQAVHVQVANVHAPELMTPLCAKGH